MLSTEASSPSGDGASSVLAVIHRRISSAVGLAALFVFKPNFCVMPMLRVVAFFNTAGYYKRSAGGMELLGD
jgi:hypothetical protein